MEHRVAQSPPGRPDCLGQESRSEETGVYKQPGFNQSPQRLSGEQSLSACNQSTHISVLQNARCLPGTEESF